MFELPVFEKLAQSRNVLIAGAGGGFDVFTGLPLYFALRSQGKNVHLANWTFSDMVEGPGGPERLSEHLFCVRPTSNGEYYFPEKYLCQWLHSKQMDGQVYCFRPCGTQQLKKAYELLVQRHSIDTILLVDGGTDSLLRGNEDTLGSPDEDMTSIAAVDQLNVPIKILASLGFGIDAFHGVCHAHVLASIAEQTMNGGYLGAISLLKSMPEVQLFARASNFALRAMPEATSIVVSSILSAINGEFGDYQVTDRTEGSELFINPLMAIYWFFDLRSVADSIVYMDEVRRAQDVPQVMSAIRCHPRAGNLKRWQNIPL